MIVVLIVVLLAGAGLLALYLVKNFVLGKGSKAGSGMVNKGNVREAIKKARAAIDKDPKDAEAHYNLAKAYIADNRPDLAYRELISVNRLGIEGKDIPETEFRETIARLYAQNREKEEALKEYVLLIKKHPENADYYYQAGLIFNDRNRFDLAEQYIKKAVSLNVRNPLYLTELGIMFYQKKKLPEALSCLDKALKIEQGNPKAAFYMGKAEKDSKNFNEALGFFGSASRDMEYKIRSLVEIGDCYMSLKMPDRAHVELERAVSAIQNEDDVDALYARYSLGVCYEKKQDFVKALAQWDIVYHKKKNFRDVGEKLTQYQQYRQEI